jgi:hypothetical protein
MRDQQAKRAHESRAKDKLAAALSYAQRGVASSTASPPQ